MKLQCIAFLWIKNSPLLDLPVGHFTMGSTSDKAIDVPEPEDKSEDQPVVSRSKASVDPWPPSLLFHNGCPLLNHGGIARTLWDIIVNVATLYIAIIVPYEITFMRANLANRPTLGLDTIMEIFFVLDILVNFRTSYEVEEVLVTDSRSICVRYVKFWLLIDIIAATPLDLLHIFNIHVIDMMHLMKTVRLVRLVRLIKKLEKYSANSTLVLSILMFSFTLIAHWAACVWYEIGLFDLGTSHWHAGWLAQMAERLERPYMANRTGGLSEADAYTGALYFTVSSMTTVGFGNISPNTKPEKWFATCLMLSGAL
uniref:Ion transport domain-containing protein n=1 Tax=Knipowitschia caucasica TaxID=637954 RepID=A0AAV2JSK0_KNICA